MICTDAFACILVDSSLWQLFSPGRKQIILSDLRADEIAEAPDNGLVKYFK